MSQAQFCTYCGDVSHSARRCDEYRSYQLLSLPAMRLVAQRILASVGLTRQRVIRTRAQLESR